MFEQHSAIEVSVVRANYSCAGKVMLNIALHEAVLISFVGTEFIRPRLKGRCLVRMNSEHRPTYCTGWEWTGFRRPVPFFLLIGPEVLLAPAGLAVRLPSPSRVVVRTPTCPLLPYAKRIFVPAGWALVNVAFESITTAKLKNGFLSFQIVACGAQAMRWFAERCLRFQRVSERIFSKIGQLIAGFFSLPIFQTSQFLFERPKSLNQYRLVALRGEDFYLQFENRRIATGGVIDVFQAPRNIKRGAQSGGKRFTDHGEPHF